MQKNSNVGGLRAPAVIGVTNFSVLPSVVLRHESPTWFSGRLTSAERCGRHFPEKSMAAMRPNRS